MNSPSAACSGGTHAAEFLIGEAVAGGVSLWVEGRSLRYGAPGGCLSAAVFQFAAAECLQEFDDGRPIDDRISGHHLVGRRGRRIA